MTKNRPDPILFWAVIALVVFGLIMISSAGTVYSSVRFDDPYFFFKRQLIGVIPGMLAFFFFVRYDYHKLEKWAVPMFVLALLSLVVLILPGVGTSAYGATRWLPLGPVSFQPSEFLKLASVVYLATWFSKRGKKNVENVREGLMPFLGVLAIVGGLLYLQPDIGTLGLIVCIAGMMYFVAGANMAHVMSLILLGIGMFFVFLKTAPYRWQRFMAFLNPGEDLQGSGYQIHQALIALGSGGIWGFGLGQSRQKFNYLPEPAGDSIFAIIGEELGMVGAVCVIVAFLVLAYKGYRIAGKAHDDFGRLLAVGITSWIILQAVINIGGITGLIPLKGMPLPFVSFGGSSLVFSLAAMGILLNISREAR